MSIWAYAYAPVSVDADRMPAIAGRIDFSCPCPPPRPNKSVYMEDEPTGRQAI